MVRPEILKLRIGRLELAQQKAEEKRILEAKFVELKQQERTRVFQRKHGKKIAIIKGLGYFTKRVGIGFGRMGKGVLKKARESEGLKQTYENMYGPQQKPRRRIAVVKRKKKKR